MNLKKKIYLYANSTAQKCPKEIIKIYLIEDFFHLPPVSTTPVVHLELRNFSANLGESDPCRKPEVKNLVALSL
jgi:hypothetical protein